MKMSVEDLERLRERFDRFTVRSESGCLAWIGGKNKRGYGRMWVGYQYDSTLKKELSHRVAWILAGKEITTEKPCILHSCDNPACCEISHLFDGTSGDNNKDRSRKDRSRRSKRGLPRGVQPNTGSSGFQARVQMGSTQIYLGSYPTVEEAFEVASLEQKKIDNQNRDGRSL